MCIIIDDVRLQVRGTLWKCFRQFGGSDNHVPSLWLYPEPPALGCSVLRDRHSRHNMVHCLVDHRVRLSCSTSPHHTTRAQIHPRQFGPITRYKKGFILFCNQVTLTIIAWVQGNNYQLEMSVQYLSLSSYLIVQLCITPEFVLPFCYKIIIQYLKKTVQFFQA